jgi:hypothetical protein
LPDTTCPDPPNPDTSPEFASKFAFDRLNALRIEEGWLLLDPAAQDIEAPGRPITEGTYLARMLATLGAEELILIRER